MDSTQVLFGSILDKSVQSHGVRDENNFSEIYPKFYHTKMAKETKNKEQKEIKDRAPHSCWYGELPNYILISREKKQRTNKEQRTKNKKRTKIEHLIVADMVRCPTIFQYPENKKQRANKEQRTKREQRSSTS